LSAVSRRAVIAAFKGWRAYSALGAIALALYLSAGIYAVPANSVGVVSGFGAIIDGAVPSGVHWWWPSPIGRVDIVEVKRTFIAPVGYRLADEAVGMPNNVTFSRWFTGDTNIVQIRARVNYRISRPARFLFGSEQPGALLRELAGSTFTEATSRLPVDELLTTGRLELTTRVKDRLQKTLDEWDMGLEVLSIDLESIDPPREVVAAFQDVQNSRSDYERLISQAQTYANGILPVARGEADRITNEALAFRDRRLSEAKSNAVRFTELAEEHRRSPALLEQRLYLETMERVLPRVRRYVLDPGSDASLPVRIIE